MENAYDHLVVVFQALARVDSSFYAARQQLSNLPETTTAESWALFGNYTTTRRNDKVTQWEREITAYRNGTEARWHFEIELAHSAKICQIRAEAGLQPKDHSRDWTSMDLRQIGPVSITDLASLPSEIDKILNSLFGDLEGDCAAAVRAERNERDEARRALE